MHKVLRKLYRDHASFTKLVDVFEHQITELKTADRSTLQLQLDLINYISNYADTIHHPIEDQLYQNVLARTDKGREALERLLIDHQIIIDMTRVLRRDLEALDKGTGVSRDEVERKGQEYIEAQREHQSFEESDAFPLLKDELESKDFDNAAGALPAEEDPLLSNELKENYPALFEHLSEGNE